MGSAQVQKGLDDYLATKFQTQRQIFRAELTSAIFRGGFNPMVVDEEGDDALKNGYPPEFSGHLSSVT